MKNTSEEWERVDLREYGFHPLSPRLWHGMTLSAWLRATWGKWHLISVRRYPLALTVTVFSIGNQLLKWATRLVFGSRLAKVKISPDPIFVIGHWRSGTTWLHHLLMKDPRFAAPTRMACFCPEFYLLTQPVVKPVLQSLIPKKRPMDNVDLDLNKAEEDEMGILLSGAPSSYRVLLFPGDGPVRETTPEEMGPERARFWRKAWLDFLRCVQFENPGKRLVLKSPTHSLRIPEILRLFPKAQFILIRRDPIKVFLSNIHNSRAMSAVSSLQDRQAPRRLHDETILSEMVAFHEQLEEGRKVIPDGQLTSLRYEDLRTDTLGTLKQIYDDLDLGGFDTVAAAIEDLTASPKPYKTNAYDIDDETRELIGSSLDALCVRHGYPPLDQRSAALK